MAHKLDDYYPNYSEEIFDGYDKNLMFMPRATKRLAL